MRVGHSKSLLFCTTALTALLAAPLAAQETVDETADGGVFTRLGRIVLGFGGTETVAIDTPQAVTVLNQDDIDKEQASTAADLFDMVPGVQGIGTGRVGGVSFNIRGVGELASSDESKIIVTVDGATKFYEQYRMGSFFSDPELYKQVEVLRGPASSTLYGSGAIGGVINFETKDAGDFLTTGNHALRFRTGYTSNGNEKLVSAIYATRPVDTFETLFALNYRKAGDYEDGDGNDVAGSAYDALSGLIKAKYTFGDTLSKSLTASYSAWNSSLDDTSYAQTDSFNFGTIDRDIFDQTFALRYEDSAPGNPWLDLDVVLTYSDTDVEQGDSSLPAISPLFEDSHYAYRTLSLKAENTFDVSFGAWQNFLTAGIQLSRQERIAKSTSGSIEFHPEGTDQKIGAYLQGEFVWNDRLTLVPGIRADLVSLQPGDGGQDYDTTLISPKIAAHYKLTEDLSVFGSLAHTERTPTLDEIYSFSPTEPASGGLDPEMANSVELGVSYSHYGIFTANDVVELKATGFYYDITDMISRDTTAGTPFYRNIDHVKLWGVELEGAYEAERGFARAAFSDVRGEDTATGLTPTSVPQRSLVLTLGGRAPEYGLEYGWRGHFYGDIDYGDGTTYDGYNLHDLFVNWSPQQGPLEGLTIGLTADNIFDTTYRNSLAGDNGEGRSYSIALTRTFEF
ncbi:TonB-dependent receptor domain-containing protein [Psychromarinibacter halotolerans]|uniref:TonB-dependent receptor domain-containing protein n=1 Tax=Psychromarinibacter halotolerans TaxID=1775175 RepID=A0ABV7GXH7_9RHOB|nr:TonB-dependent receptor [Psychromarinibacter halotolerans]MDF0597992.1 TonB-dependent receptor [Psychromarinibacter halotolerans]